MALLVVGLRRFLACLWRGWRSVGAPEGIAALGI